jgi:hypothetical protein
MHFSGLLLALCLFFLQLPILAQGSPGFLLATDPSIPAAVSRASRLVYKITSQGGHFNRTVSITDTNQVEAAQNDFAGSEKWWQKVQLEFCQLKNFEFCPIFDQMGDGSAFMLKTGDSMYTNLHNFFEIISANGTVDKNPNSETISKRNLHKPLLFGLSNQNGEPIFDSSKANNGTLEFFNPSAYLLTSPVAIMNGGIGRVSDVVKVHLSNANFPPLKIAKQQPKVGDSVYLIGYPSQTTNRTLVGAQDSDGKSLRISVGKVISFSDWKVKSGNNFSPYDEKLLNDHLIFFDSDCEHGNSGGPLVNSDGEVVGIMMALYWDESKGQPYRLCGALNTMDEAKLEAIWKAISP